MVLASLLDLKIKALRFGILEVKDSFNIMMLIVQLSMKLISTLTEDIYCHLAMIQLWKSGILDKDTFCTHYMVMKVLPHLLHFHHAEITLQLVEVTPLLWYGKVIWTKMNKNLLKILEQSLLQLMQEECQLWVRKDQRLERDKAQPEALKLEELPHKNQLTDKLQELVEIWTMIIILPQLETIPMAKVVVEKNSLKP